MEFDQAAGAADSWRMNTVEFTTELSGAAVLPIPREIAAQLPKSGKARVIVLTDEDESPPRVTVSFGARRPIL